MGTNEEYGLVPYKLLRKQGKSKLKNAPIGHNTLGESGHRAEENFNQTFFSEIKE